MDEVGFGIVRFSDHKIDAAHGFTKGRGINQQTVGARDLNMAHGVLPPGTVSTPHYHPDSQSAIYVLSGGAIVRFGACLEHEHVVGAGDFIYIDKGVIHQVVNENEDAPYEFIVVRDSTADITVDVEVLGAGSSGAMTGPGATVGES